MNTSFVLPLQIRSDQVSQSIERVVVCGGVVWCGVVVDTYLAETAAAIASRNFSSSL